MKKAETEPTMVCVNRRASFDYAFDDTMEAGLALTGSEVKALRAGDANLSDSYATPERGELFLLNAHISSFRGAAAFGHLPRRKRKLLMHRSEIDKWTARVTERGYSIIPIGLYFSNGRAKVRLGLGKGKKNFDRRETIRQRDDAREVQGEMRRKLKRG